jgi:hypothetical protein
MTLNYLVFLRPIGELILIISIFTAANAWILRNAHGLLADRQGP